MLWIFQFLSSLALINFSNAQGKSTLGLIASARRDPSLTEEVLCYNFSVGNPKLREFYSPGYPGNYYDRVECVLSLQADFGYVIRLDFRDQFEVEPSSQCEYDFLEVRDGAYGYSQLIGRFCGRHFPPRITSSDRFLWLRFSSDDNIEYAGFRAVYEFLPNLALNRPEASACQFNVTGLDGLFGTSDIPEERRNYTLTYQVPLDCTWVITVEPHRKIQLSFPKYDLAAPNDCALNYIEVFAEKTDHRHRLRQFCGSTIEIVTSQTNILHVRFFTVPDMIKSSFQGLFTAITLYRETEITGKCAPNEFDCDDATCIDMSLRCNGRINCKYRWDEDKCKAAPSALVVLTHDHIIVILTIGLLLMCSILTTCLYRCIRKLRADHHVYQARRSRSREDRLDVVGDTSSKLKRKQMQLSKPLMQRSNGEDLSQVFDRQRIQSSTSRSLSSPIDLMSNGYMEALQPLNQGHLGYGNGSGPNTKLDMAEVYEIPEDEQASGEENDDVFDDDDDDDTETRSVEMVDNSCQTRDSLFQNRDSSDAHRFRSSNSGARPDDSSQYKAEAVIEISRKHKMPPLRASSSVASSKSGPDLVVMH